MNLFYQRAEKKWVAREFLYKIMISDKYYINHKKQFNDNQIHRRKYLAEK